METHEPRTPFHTVRRRDRAVEDEAWIRALLHRAPAGVLAGVYEGQPIINTNTFVYDETAHAIYMHTARSGHIAVSLARGGSVRFSVSKMGRMLPASVAREFSVEYASVVISGHAAIIADHAEAEHALQILLDKYFPHLRPGVDYQPITARDLELTAVYRITIEGWSGKKKEVAADFPGAFFYGDTGLYGGNTS